MRRRAAALGRLIRAEDGVAEAVRVVDEFFCGDKRIVDRMYRISQD
jgi:UDP:flavonoid glycosyltransferase YjiC (YdhE family)